MKKIITLILMVLMMGSFSVFAGELTIYKGWNLIDYNVIDGASIPEEEIGGIYYLDPRTKEYVGGKSIDDFYSKITNKNKEYTDSFFVDYFDSNTPLWIYYKNEKPLSITPKESAIFLFPQKKLISGWNFFSFKKNLVGKSFDDFKGDCNILNIYFYIPSSTSDHWEKIDINRKISENYVSQGFVIKVQDNCEFNFNSEKNTISPPQIPDDNSNLQEDENKNNMDYKEELYLIENDRLKPNDDYFPKNIGNYEYDGSMVQDMYGDGILIDFKYEDISIPEEIRASILEITDKKISSLENEFTDIDRFYYKTVRGGKSLIYDSQKEEVSWFSENDKYYFKVSTKSENFYLITDFLMYKFPVNFKSTLRFNFQNYHEVFDN